MARNATPTYLDVDRWFVVDDGEFCLTEVEGRTVCMSEAGGRASYRKALASHGPRPSPQS